MENTKINPNIFSSSKRRVSNQPTIPIYQSANLNNKYDYPILEYQEKFKSNYSQMKGSLAGIMGNITNYKHEIAKLEDFLIMINEHEKNHKAILKKYIHLKKILEESIEIESLIGKLSSNQQIINISEYVNLHSKVKEIIKFFQDSQLVDKKDFENSLVKQMWRGFKVYEETFYLILKRYESMDLNPSTENEKMNLLNKIRSLAECLQDEDINYDFTSKLIRDRRETIVFKFEDMKMIINKNLNEDKFEKNCGLITRYLIESEKMFSAEKDYIYKILSTCNSDLKELVYSGIIEIPLEKILFFMKELVQKHNKTNLKKIDFYQNFDILNIWHERILKAYTDLVKNYCREIFNNLSSVIKIIENFCYKYIDDFIKEILTINEKIENENILKICNDVIFFLSNLLVFDIGYEFIKNEFESNKINFTIENLIENLIKKLESKSSILEKKYAPLKYIFLINNVYFIQSKIYQKPINNYVSKTFADSINNIIISYIDSYLEVTWSKVNEVTFNEKENKSLLIYETDGKTLKNSVKELIKKKFATFNENMKINLKFQQHLQIIDSTLEKRLIIANIEYLVDRYVEFYGNFNDTGFTKFRNKYILFTSRNDVVQDLQLYFMPDSSRK